MAKKAKAKKAKKATKKKTKTAKKPKRTQADQAWAIVSQVVAHFGAGYWVQRESENPGSTVVNPQIFETPGDIAQFSFLLHKSTKKNFSKLNWANDQPTRDAVCAAAFAHGKLARQKVVADGGTMVNLAQILETLKTIQKSMCPSPRGAGGGLVCDF